MPLYEGKMVQAFDHRAASVVVNPENQHRPAQPEPATLEQHQGPDWLPDPQFWVRSRHIYLVPDSLSTRLQGCDCADQRPVYDCGVIPGTARGNTLAALLSDRGHGTVYTRFSAMFLANLNALCFDFVARQKIQGQHLNWYIVEQLPVVPPERYEAVRFGAKRLGRSFATPCWSYLHRARHGAFARDMGHVDDAGEVRPPFVWDEDRRLKLRAKLDAVYFHLYGVTDRDDVRYIYSTFPIVEREETAASAAIVRASCALPI